MMSYLHVIACNVTLLPLERQIFIINCAMTNIYAARHVDILCELFIRVKVIQILLHVSHNGRMTPLNVLSWNVRGLNSKIKRSLIFTYIKKYNPHICILHETHLTGSRTLALKKPWVGSHYHSTYSTYSRGVSVLIHKSLPFTLLDLHLDPEGKYVASPHLCQRR